MNTFSMQNISVIISVLFSGLIAGLFYGYACSVNAGLGRLPDLEYLKAMQSINKVILNPIFFLSFFGALLITPLAAWANHTYDSSYRFYLLVTAAVIYFIGVFGVTAVGNVPLNERLADFNLQEAIASALHTHRINFESNWNTYHLIRTVASIVCFVLTILSTIKTK